VISKTAYDYKPSGGSTQLQQLLANSHHLQRSPPTTTSPFTLLSADLFPHILHYLDYADILALKFVCRDFNANTSSINPRVLARQYAELLVPRALSLHSLQDASTSISIRRQHTDSAVSRALREGIIDGAIRAWRKENVTRPIVELEAQESRTLALLTCSECGERGERQDGVLLYKYSEKFDQEDTGRRCLRCCWRVPIPPTPTERWRSLFGEE